MNWLIDLWLLIEIPRPTYFDRGLIRGNLKVSFVLLADKFGLSDSQEPVKRKVVEHGMFVKHCKVEVYYIEFQLAENSNLEETKKKKFSKSDTLGEKA